MSNDFYMPLVAVMNGYRAIVDTSVRGQYSIVKTYRAEFIRKVRTVVHGIQVLLAFGKILIPIRYGLFWLKIVSHKLCRWLVPFFLIAMFISNLFLFSANPVYKILLAGQLAVYIVGLMGLILPASRKLLPVRIAYFFAFVNLSILVAWYKYLSGEKYVQWEPSKR